MSGETILIVEDNAIVAFALQRSLTRLGYRVLEPVDSGETAVSSALEQRPQLVLMDIGLEGEMDGVAAAEKILAQVPTIVIYLTGNNHDARLTKSLCLSKPVAEKDLVQLIEQVLRQG